MKKSNVKNLGNIKTIRVKGRYFQLSEEKKFCVILTHQWIIL